MAATVGVEIAGKRAEQRKSEGEGGPTYISQTGKAEAEKVRLMGDVQASPITNRLTRSAPRESRWLKC